MSDQRDYEEGRRLHKMNELLSHLPPEQRELITQRLSRSAPNLIRSKDTSSTSTKGSSGKIDTPMRRAKSLARSILKRERQVRQKRDYWDHPEPPNSQPQVSTEGELVSWIDEDIAISESLPMNTLLSLHVDCLLKAYLASDLDDWLKALKIVDPEVKEHLLFTLPVRYASELEDALRSLGPIKLSEAQEATQRVMARVQQLGARGEVKLSL